MNVQPVINTSESMALSIQDRLTSEKEIAQTDKKPVKEPDLSRLAALAADLQKNLNIVHDVDLQFKVHKASGKVMVTVTNESTGEVIREIPPLEMLQLAAKIDEMIGMIFDKKG